MIKNNLDSSAYNKAINKRIFIGLTVPDGISRYFHDMISAVSSSYSCIKPVPPENIHLTLKFLGNTCASDIDKIKSRLNNELKEVFSFNFDIEDRIDAFPGLKNARIVYAVLGNGKEKVESIYKKTGKAVSFMNLKKENKKFIPHITIARIRDGFDFTKLIPEIKPKKFISIKCDRVLIYESILSEKGADYFINSEIRLKDKRER
jgi:2'-5' RNA ligase